MPPNKSHILAFDFGEKRVGVAVGNARTQTAQALTTLPAKRGVVAAADLQKLLREWSPELLVVGLPLHMSGESGDAAQAAKHFGETLRVASSLPVKYVDERLTTREADALLAAADAGARRSARRRDSLAAELILRAYFADNPA